MAGKKIETMIDDMCGWRVPTNRSPKYNDYCVLVHTCFRDSKVALYALGITEPLYG